MSPDCRRAIVRFLTAEEGGRTSDPGSGVRPQMKVGHIQTSCTVRAVDGAPTLERGKLTEVIISPLFLDQVKNAFLQMRSFEMFEGWHKVAEGWFLDA